MKHSSHTVIVIIVHVSIVKPGEYICMVILERAVDRVWVYVT